MPRYGLKVDQFLGHFVSQAKDIGKVVSPFHRKMLYASAIDPLARAAYGTIGTHRDRFVRLIRDVAKWPESERVSLPQLQLRLLEAKRHRYLLYRNISKRLASWEDGGKVLLSGSPSMAEILVQAAPSEHALAKEAQYVNLFYTYRNNLIHEFREPGYGTDWSGKSVVPFYGSYIDGPWELVFPVGFIAALYEQALTGLRVHMLANNIDPYKQFNFGSLWRAK